MDNEILKILSKELEYFINNSIEDSNGNVKTILAKRHIAKINDLEIVVYPNDHNPPHFHVTSKQNNTHARIIIDNFELMSGSEISISDHKKVKKFFEDNPEKLYLLKQEAKKIFNQS